MACADTKRGREIAAWTPESRCFQRELGYRVKWARNQAGLTQKELAKAIGMNNMSVCLIERGEMRTVTENLYKIARATKVPIVKLVEFADQLQDIS